MMMEASINECCESEIYRLVADKTGICLPENLSGSFMSACPRIALALGYETTNDLLGAITDNRMSYEGWRTLIHEATIHETEFYRFPAIYQFCVEVLKFNGGGTVWFPACSEGQEVYTVAEMINKAAAENTRLIGTDISHQCVNAAKNGVYRRRTDQKMLESGIEHDNTSISIPRTLRACTEFEYHNLATGNGKMVSDVDIIVCTRMLIYYPNETRHKMLENMGRSLKAGGYICVGLLEDASWNHTNYKQQRNRSFTIFKKVAE